ncbi:MAG: hypothetical protein HPM95_18510 [Alphaproteobacteria bacterium]|nr:hypothetical protein [Alphaproteobacteria bacterium]
MSAPDSVSSTGCNRSSSIITGQTSPSTAALSWSRRRDGRTQGARLSHRDLHQQEAKRWRAGCWTRSAWSSAIDAFVGGDTYALSRPNAEPVLGAISRAGGAPRAP